MLSNLTPLYSVFYLIYLFILAGITVGNVLPVGQMPEGTVICQVEEKNGDRGKLARASGKFKAEYFILHDESKALGYEYK